MLLAEVEGPVNEIAKSPTGAVSSSNLPPSSCCRPATPNLCSFTSIRSERGKSRSREGHQLNYRCTTKLHNVLDGLAMNLEKGYRPTGDFIIEDADYQPAGIPSLCIEVCPTSIVTGPSLNW